MSIVHGNKPLIIVTRQFSGSPIDIIGVTYEREIASQMIALDIPRWTLPVTYNLEPHWVGYGTLPKTEEKQ